MAGKERMRRGREGANERRGALSWMRVQRGCDCDQHHSHTTPTSHALCKMLAIVCVSAVVRSPASASHRDYLRLPATVYESNSSMRHAPRASSSIAQRAADATVPSAPPPAPCKSLAVRAGNAHELCHGRCLSRLTDAPRMPRPTSHELYPCCVGNASSAALLCV
jgi:hypothetical protein